VVMAERNQRIGNRESGQYVTTTSASRNEREESVGLSHCCGQR
jgi:hypothetical protein